MNTERIDSEKGEGQMNKSGNIKWGRWLEEYSLKRRPTRMERRKALAHGFQPSVTVDIYVL